MTTKDTLSQKFKSLFLSLLTFTLGLAIYFRFNVLDVTPEQNREVAAVESKIHQIKNFDLDQLKNELQKKIEITTDNMGNKHINLAALSANVCRVHKKIMLEFISEGSSVGGEPTTMKITSGCHSGKDITEIADIVIPASMIKKNKPTDQKLTFDDVINGKKSLTQIELKNMADTWPRTWVLKTISFSTEKNETRLVGFDTSLKNTDELIVLEF